jgi:hypothetical protein
MVFDAAAPLLGGRANDLGWDARKNATVNMSGGRGLGT